MSEVQEAVQALKLELQEIQDPARRERMEILLKRLESQLDNQNDEELPTEINGFIEHFEAEHPQLVQILNRVAVTLSDMGI